MLIRFVFFLFIPLITIGQIAVTNNLPFDSEEYIVNNVLLGDDLNTSNFSSIGFQNGIGYFDGFNSNIGFEEGVILSTGGICFPAQNCDDGTWEMGSGIAGDADLELALTEINLDWPVNNVTILEFDFVAESESVSFNYVFASAEYTTFTCTQYNDIFGFFLSGPGINGIYSDNAVNIALVPDPDNPGQFTDTPVAVNTINDGEMADDPNCNDIDANFEAYNIYWIDNEYSLAGWGVDGEGVNQPPDPEYTIPTFAATGTGITGFTVPLQAQYNGLECGETYHIKLAIADAVDSGWNTAVFLEANSFVSPSVVVNPIPNIDGPSLFDDPDAIYEGCAAAQLEFVSSGNTEYAVILGLEFNGTAEYGVDFIAFYDDEEFSEFDTCGDEPDTFPCITIPAGQELFYINIEAFYDEDDTEVSEDLGITLFAVDGVCQQAELAASEISFNLYDQIEIEVDPGPSTVIECFGDEAILEPASISGGYIGETNNYTYEWYDENGNQIGTNSSVEVSTSENGEYQLVVFDDCQDQSVTTAFSVEVIEYPVIEMTTPPYFACYGDEVTITPTLSGGSENYSYVWPDNSVEPSFDYTFVLAEGNIQEVSLQVIDDCTNQAFDFSVFIELETQSAIEMIAPPYFACYGDEVTIIPTLSGGSESYSYVWPDNPNACDCQSFDYIFELGEGDIQAVDFQIIDNCTNQSFDFSISIELETQSAIEMTAPPYFACYGDEVTITPTLSGGSGSYSYVWSDNSINQSFDYIFALGEGEIQSVDFQIIDDCTNQSFAFNIPIELETQSAIEMIFAPDPLCYGDVTNVSPNVSGGSGSYSYVWPDNSNNTSFDYVFEVSGGEIQDLDFQVIDNCTNEAYEFNIVFNLNLTSAPAVSFSQNPDLQFCPGDQVILTALANGESTYTYQWVDPNTDIIAVFNNDVATVYPIEDSTYEVEVIDDCNGLSWIFSTNVDVQEYAFPQFSLPSIIGCVGEELDISVEIISAEAVSDLNNPDTDLTFLWDNTGETTQTITVTVQESEVDYFVEVTDLCGNTTTTSGSIEPATVSPSIPPIPEFSFSYIDESVQFNPTQTTIDVFDDFEWSFGDGSNSGEESPLHIYEPGSYDVRLTAYNEYGCANEFDAIINIVLDLFFYSPDIFSPNGDGINDDFKVSVVGYDSFELFVFDRWGNQLFSSKDPNKGWRGVYPNGNEVPQDVYMYKVVMDHESGSEKIATGKVSIIK